jgi:hypothetical protein
VAIAIDTLFDMADLSIEAVTGWLKVINDDDAATSAPDQPILFGSKLYFIEVQTLRSMLRSALVSPSSLNILESGLVWPSASGCHLAFRRGS